MAWYYDVDDTPSPGDQCKGRSAYDTSVAGNITVCKAGCSYKPDPSKEVWRVKGVMGGVTMGGGRMIPTGDTCGAGPENNPELPPSNEPPRKLCGGGSCYDSASGQFCALNGSGEQVCISADKGKSPGGGCVSGGDTTLCAGNPPPIPPNPPIADPATDIKSSDQYGSQKGSGPIINTTVNNSNSSGNSPNAGKGPNDADGSGKKPDDQKKDDGSSASGGGDCSSPPLVEGSPALGMVARQTWLLRCGDTGQGGDDSDKTVPGLDGISETPGDGFKKEISVLDKLDSSGFGGGGTCPRLPDIDLGAFGHLSMQGDWWCDLLITARYVILLLGMWVALRILGEN